jgi:hypothetical protein
VDELDELLERLRQDKLDLYRWPKQARKRIQH